MKIFSKIREFFWPLLEKEILKEPAKITPEEIQVSDDYLEKTLEYAIDNYEAELERKKTVESKSSLFIGTISVITTVIIGVTSLFIKTSEFDAAILGLVILLFLLTLYMSRTVWFSIKALERGTYHTISINDFLVNGNKSEYHKKIISDITNKIKANYKTINNKVDNMTMAQEYFKRAIVIVVLYSLGIVVFLISKSEYHILPHLNIVIEYINKVNLNGWNILLLYTIAIISLIISIRTIKSNK